MSNVCAMPSPGIDAVDADYPPSYESSEVQTRRRRAVPEIDVGQRFHRKRIVAQRTVDAMRRWRSP